jgi:hypothetical protein
LPKPTTEAGPGRILVVDDQRNLLSVTAFLLECQGYQLMGHATIEMTMRYAHQSLSRRVPCCPVPFQAIPQAPATYVQHGRFPTSRL